MSLKTKIATYRVKRVLTERRQLTELKTYEGKLARIVGKPFATRLDKAYPKSQLGRSALIQAIEMSNNAEMLGYTKANVNGESLRGFYFRATDGSAKGVAWQAAVDVYRAKQVGPDVFFAHDSRIGTKVQAESEEPEEVDTLDDEDEDEDEDEECDCEDEDCDCTDVEEGCKGKKKKVKPVAEMGPANEDQFKAAASLTPIDKAKKGDMVTITYKGEKVTGKVVQVKKAGVVTVNVERTRSNPGGHSDEDVGYVDVRLPKKSAKELQKSVGKDEPEITEKVGTKLIQRAATGLGAGASDLEVAKSLQKSGVSKEDAFLAIKAAKILVGDMMKGESKDTKPLPPLHKWPVKIVGKGQVEYTLGSFKVTEKGEPPGSGLYIYELFSGGKSAGKFNNQREVVSKAQALRGK